MLLRDDVCCVTSSAAILIETAKQLECCNQKSYARSKLYGSTETQPIMTKAWQRDLRESFGGREELSVSELASMFGLQGEASEAALRECLKVFEDEYALPMGLLRPEDSLQVFATAPRITNPLRWFMTRAAFEDRTSELNYRLKRQRRRLDRPPLTVPPITLQEYANAWLGK